MLLQLRGTGQLAATQFAIRHFPFHLHGCLVEVGLAVLEKIVLVPVLLGADATIKRQAFGRARLIPLQHFFHGSFQATADLLRPPRRRCCGCCYTAFLLG